jgi:phosphatidylglycerophosphatase C
VNRQVAAWDFDGTITKRDTLVPFLFAQNRLGFVPGALRATITGQFREGNRRDIAKAVMVRAIFAGRSAQDVETAGGAYAASLPRLYRPESLERIAWHKAQGHELVLVTASLGAYARPAATTLGFDHVIATELEATSPEAANSTLTGNLAGPNVRGPEKAARLTAWLAGSTAELWAYGDSNGDNELLAMAQHPTRIRSTK